MPITALELVGYRRLRTTSIDKLAIQFKERLQLILGGNGCGKSSLLAELFPLPAETAMYRKDGYKRSVYEVHGSVYELMSTMSPVRHSFKKDGVELNPGGTQTVQKQLAKEHFGITPDIRDMLIKPSHRFTNLKAAERREWFTLFSEVNYDYALQTYDRIKKRLSEINGAIKDHERRLTRESASLVTPEEQERLKQEIEILHQELEALQQQRTPLHPQAHTFARQQQEKTETLIRLTDRMIRLKYLLFGKLDYEDREMLDVDIEDAKRRITQAESQLKVYYQSHEKIDKQLAILKQAGEQGVSELRAKIEAARAARDAIRSHLHLGLAGFEAQAALNAYYSVRESLTELFIQLPENRDNQFSSQQHKENEEALYKLRGELLEQQKRHRALLTEKEKLDSHKQQGHQDCPKCGFRWIAGYSDERHRTVLEKLDHAAQRLTEQEAQIKKLEEKIAQFEQYRAQYLQFTRLVKNWPVLQPFWDKLLDEKLVVTAPRKANALFETLEEDLKLECQANLKQQEIEELTKLLNDAAQLGDLKFKDAQAQLEALDEKIQQLTLELTRAQSDLKTLLQTRTQVEEYLSLSEEVSQLIRQIEQLTVEQIEDIARRCIHEQIQQLQVSLATKTKKLHEIDTQRTIVERLEGNLKELRTQEAAARLLLTELSPTDGLIAEGLFGSIQSFVAEMNAFIRKIWTHTLEILPCGMSTEDGTELDYVFPFIVEHEDNVISDVSQGSLGQMEVINLAFRIIAMKRLRLVDPMLILDEFGLGLDNAHSVAASHAIERLIESDEFRQVFMVSHYETSYGALTNAQICVLNKENILLPKDKAYNQHVVLEHA